MMCRDAGSPHVSRGHAAVLHAAVAVQCGTIRLLQEAVRVDTAVVALVASGVG